MAVSGFPEDDKFRQTVVGSLALGNLGSEMGKRERERLVHTFTHERGSNLAHVLPQFLVHERE